jgi:MtN3 and saliva related transmembrane protein
MFMDWLHSNTETIGFWAATLTTVSFVPQVVRTYRTGGKDLSWWMLAMFGSGVGLWLAYGILRASSPVTVANGVTAFLVLCIVALKLRAM